MAHENWNNSAFESDDESDDDESSKKKKKKAEDLAKLLAKKDEEAEAKAKPEDDPSIWEKLTGSDTKDKASKEKSHEAIDEEAEAAAEGNAEITEATATEAEDEEAGREEVTEVPLEDLSERERADAVEAYVDARVAELSETPPDEEPEAAAARAADLALLIALNERMKRDNSMERPLVDKINEAYADTSGGFAPSPAPGEFVPRGGQDSPMEFPDDEPIPLAETAATPSTRLRAEALSAATRMVPKAEAMYYEQKAQARGLLVGAAVGYLIGRRRNRIKTEKRLKTVERKLQKKVNETQDLVAAKEQEIQKLAVANYRRTGEVPEMPPLPVIAKQAETRATAKPNETQSSTLQPVAAANRAERTSNKQDRQQESEFARADFDGETMEPMDLSPAEALLVPVPVPVESRSSQTRPEELQKWRAESQPLQPRSNETPPPAKPEITPPPIKPELPLPAKPASKEAIEKMNKQELLDYSAQLPMGESSLRRVYDAKLVNEEGLRRLIIAHESGQDMRRALAREFLAKELKFEHDPRLHGRPLDEGNNLTGGGRASTDDRYSAAAAAAVGAGQDDNRVPSSRSSDRQSQNSGTGSNGVSPLLLVGLTILTILLAIYAIWLTVTR